MGRLTDVLEYDRPSFEVVTQGKKRKCRCTIYGVLFSNTVDGDIGESYLIQHVGFLLCRPLYPLKFFRKKCTKPVERDQIDELHDDIEIVDEVEPGMSTSPTT